MLNDTYKTIETFLWFKSWFKNYFLTTALHQINSILLFFSSILGIYLLIKKKLKIEKYDALLILSILLVNLTCMLLIPEIRYYWGPHIALSIICISLIIWPFNINLLEKYNFYRITPIITLLLFVFIKVIPMFKYSDLVNLPIRAHDYSSKKKVGEFDGFEVFTNNWQCADIKEICVNTPKKQYYFSYVYKFLHIKNK